MFGMKPDSSEVALLVDIESDGANATLLSLAGNGPARILAAVHSELSYEHRSPEGRIAGVRACLDEVTQKVLDVRSTVSVRTIDRVYAVVHMPWVDVRVLRGELIEAQGLRITNDLIATIAQEAMRREHMDAQAHIESSVVRIELNGYRTAKPFDKHAKHIALTILVSTCDPAMHEAVVQTVGKSHVSVTPQLRSSIRGLVLGTTNISSISKGEHTLVDMSRAGSRIIHVQDGLPVTITNIEHGLSDIFEHIDDSKHPADIMAAMRLLERGEVHGPGMEDFLQRLARAEGRLVELFAQAFAGSAHTAPLPQSLVLVAPPIIVSWLARFFARSEFIASVVTHMPFVVTPLDARHYRQWVEVVDGVDARLGSIAAAALVHNEYKLRNGMVQ